MPNQTSGLVNHTQKHNIHALRLAKNKYFFYINFTLEQINLHIFSVPDSEQQETAGWQAGRQ
ncbi:MULTISPECIES: hypothetical protein [unclassified Janthinobacterium]|uniref:hypothetical protein n=1 Tax=unclassified Janthinobacterium TaxID=2610881 RepID=UPI0016167F07|nr:MULTISPECIES: hypothetical protein [unclassified Janthinobacterium]MBB5609780.1 hypothetical protein [Janthinobacterium sp. S3T4]MBB5614952.1 hypothetical protein [Janthinobacterium sp. S3M3]